MQDLASAYEPELERKRHRVAPQALVRDRPRRAVKRACDLKRETGSDEQIAFADATEIRSARSAPTFSG